jgi:hypothetical protein
MLPEEALPVFGADGDEVPADVGVIPIRPSCGFDTVFVFEFGHYALLI